MDSGAAVGNFQKGGFPALGELPTLLATYKVFLGKSIGCRADVMRSMSFNSWAVGWCVYGLVHLAVGVSIGWCVVGQCVDRLRES